MADISMGLDETLELDTIIKQSSIAQNPINNITYTGPNTKDYNMRGIEKHTSVFDPQEPGAYTIAVNGQELSVEVTDTSTIPDSVVDQFEWGGPVSDHYSVFEGDASIDQTSPVYEGSYSLKPDSSTGTELHSFPGDGLSYYPQSGDQILFHVYDTASGGGAEGTMAFSAADASNYYMARAVVRDGFVAIAKFVNRNYTVIERVNVTLPTETWLAVLVDFESDGTTTDVRVRVYNAPYETAKNPIADISGSDSETDLQENRGVGWRMQTNQTGVYDDCRALQGGANFS